MLLTIHLDTDSYDIILKRGCLSEAGILLNLKRKVFIVTDTGVPAQYAEAVASQCGEPYIKTVTSGEGSKCFSVLENLLSSMLERGFTRTDCVVAVGGGVVGDLAGFTASCYMRGIDFYIIPTTVLSQVDSSIGGKTAVNLGGVKNIVGAFWQPRRVLIDPDTLKTLPERQIANGLAEAVKAGLIADEALFSIFETDGGHLDEEKLDRIIEASLAVKKAVVEEDEREGGLRKILNFGHTIGHGIESVTGLYHRECVAIGMIPMCAPAVREQLIPVLHSLGLPTRVDADPDDVYAAMLHDKKVSGGTVSVIRVDKPGGCFIEAVSPESLKEAVMSVTTGIV